MTWLKWIPNAISLARMGATPYVAYLIVMRDMKTALPVLFVTGISDGIDGWLARRFGWTSRLGAILDPIGDKFLVATVFLALAYAGVLAWWLVGVILGRDLLIVLFAAWAVRFTKVRSFPPSIWGKISTAFQLLLAGDSVLALAYPENFLAATLPFWKISALITTAWSGFHYAWTAGRLLTSRTPD